MTQATGKINTDILPVLTEVADASTTDIPTLTEIHIEALDTSAPEPLSDVACQYLATQIAPQVDALLQEAVRDIKSRLPELIRSAMDSKHPL